MVYLGNVLLTLTRLCAFIAAGMKKPAGRVYTGTKNLWYQRKAGTVFTFGEHFHHFHQVFFSLR